MKSNLLRLRGNYLALMFLAFILHSSNLKAQGSTILVKGVVQNNSNEPLPGVSVIIRNTNTNFTSGISTDSSGVFTFPRITSGGPYSFTFSTVGYESQSLSGYNIKNGATLSLAIKMTPTAASLEQVVVVGYGTQKRKDVTGSVASVDADKLRDLAVTRVDQALMGKLAGVQGKAKLRRARGPTANPNKRHRQYFGCF